MPEREAALNQEAVKLVKSAESGNKSNRRAVRAIVFGAGRDKTPVAKLHEGKEIGRSHELPEDPLESLSSQGRIHEPPFDLLMLAMLPEHSTELGPVLEAMEVNIEGFGHRFVPRIDMDKADDETKAAVRKEHTFLTNFFAHASLRDSFTATRRKLRRDHEGIGNSYYEVIRSATGDIHGLNHLPGYQMRLGVMDQDQIKVEVPILELQVDGSVKVVEITTWQRFRRFVQSRTVQRQNLSFVGTGKLRWFKEFGDPRVYNQDTGDEVTGEDLATFPEEKRANEVVHFRIYSPRTPYGLPRFIGNLLSIFGDRAAEEINFTTFTNNNVPSSMILVSNGQLTDDTLARIKEFMESLQSSDNRSKMLLIEAESADQSEVGEDGGHVKIEVVPMTDSQHSDAMFLNYQDKNKSNIPRSWRIPPIFVGKSQDFTKATAEASRKLADEQVFAPERDEVDAFINRRLFPSMNIIYHRFKSNSPNTTDNAELVKLVANAEKTGGMTPRIARGILEDILGLELPAFPEGFNPDVPFSLTMAEAVKNLADPTEPGQQVTALKTLDFIEKLTGGDLTDEQEEQAVGVALSLQRYFEMKSSQSTSSPGI